MAVQGIEWLLLFIIITIIIYVIYKIWEDRKLDNMASNVLRFIITRDKSSIADIVVHTGIRPKDVYKVIERLYMHDLIDIIGEDSKITYIIPRGTTLTSCGIEPATGGQPGGRLPSASRSIMYAPNRIRNRLRLLTMIVSVALIIVIIGMVVNYIYESSTSPAIQVVSTNARSYLAGLDIRARITATLYNYGTANGYASVKFYTICDSEVTDQSIQTVFVPKGQYATVEADLDILAFSSCNYNVIILSQSKA